MVNNYHETLLISDMVIEAFRQPAIKQPYVMRSLAMPTYDVTKFTKSDELVNRSFWWEVLCVVRSRPPYILDKVIEVLNCPSLKVSPVSTRVKLKCVNLEQSQ